MCLGVPGRITEIIDPNKKLAIVDVSGVKRQVNIACIVDDQNPPESCVGNWVLIHVGFAMNRIDEREAAETLKLLEEIIIAQGTMSNYE
ncbi:[NiFe] hydrogenase metallocenter assembly protein HypC [Richelia intracellularis HH01]|jgi:hydrogenase expression/formation protein HypC|uniref:[NiFe] hydrogenase metallocenter assembly protein HypC n=1 Tax=Richelia intracellularis HH01 TaxID=1165094 RepID=M1X091_9NOST|nr:HypC/HybG/HupF family hydrogenase formation chaperone [Richelia intracellularis]CCH68167.1 [NiFe] hydrogenase metallocenter assembly protein HypC [Richelia intracellularis HH01]HAE06518.1 HypC/HybG/HupF family hydrogenase formation chaperone [Richelia sp.]